MDDMQETLNTLINKHVVTLKYDGKALLFSLRSSQPDILEAKEAFHKIKGGSSTIGFKDLSEAAKAMEIHLKDLLKENGTLSNQTYQLMETFENNLSELRPDLSILLKK